MSKASDDLPEPETPVMTTSLFLGISRVTFFRLCSRAPRTEMLSMGPVILAEGAGPVVVPEDETPARPEGIPAGFSFGQLTSANSEHL